MRLRDIDVRKYAWVRRWFWRASENDEMGTFDDLMGAEFEFRTRFKLGKLPCSGDVETHPSHGDLLLDAMSIAEMKSLMSDKKRRLRRLCPVCDKLTNNVNRYCSPACMAIGIERKKSPVILRGHCARCSKAMMARKGGALNKYCSKECRSVIAKERYEAELLARQMAYQQILVSSSGDAP
jgi:predicted nucleic acid-binding Zn ribbon protein